MSNRLLSKDYIDREVARRIIDSPRSQTQMLNMLKSVPKADVKEVVHAHWIERYLNGFGNMICECSNCHFNNERRNFCPNCGAIMDESEKQ